MNDMQTAIALSSMIENHMMPQEFTLQLTKALIPAGVNICFAGLSDSGKCNVLLTSIKEGMGPDERIVTNIDQCREISCHNEEVTVDNILRLAKETDPHRIVVDLKSSEILEVSEILESMPWVSLVAAVYADNVEQLRFKIWKMFAARRISIPEEYLDQQINEMFDVILFFKKMWSGQRVLDSVVEVGLGEYRVIYSFNYNAYEKSLGSSPMFIWEMGQYFSSEFSAKITARSGCFVPGKPTIS